MRGFTISLILLPAGGTSGRRKEREMGTWADMEIQIGRYVELAGSHGQGCQLSTAAALEKSYDYLLPSQLTRIFFQF